MTLWLEKCNNESETVNWILANTKKCPLCMVRIEKNQGCNHMTCRNKGCKHEFCWVCMDPWCVHQRAHAVSPLLLGVNTVHVVSVVLTAGRSTASKPAATTPATDGTRTSPP